MSAYVMTVAVAAALVRPAVLVAGAVVAGRWLWRRTRGSRICRASTGPAASERADVR